MREDDVIGLPTETVYGLAARISSEEGLKKIFATKERPFFDPLIIHVSSFKQAQSLVAEWSPLADFLARRFWPGPLTLVLPKASSVHSLITSGLETVGIRYPAHPLAQELIQLLGEPVAAPSANKFGKTSPSCVAHVQSEFEDLYVLDGGACEVGLESTVCAVSEEPSIVQILRPGAITQEQIENELRKWSNPTQVLRIQSAASPGHLEHHYQPNIPLFILQHPGEPTAAEKQKLSIKNPTSLKINSDPALVARELYADLRRLAESGADSIYVYRNPQQVGGFWEAIWDRLNRAAQKNESDSSLHP